MAKLPKMSGPEYAYMGRFRKEKFLRQGHNAFDTTDLISGKSSAEEMRDKMRAEAAAKKDDKSSLETIGPLAAMAFIG